jgi:hypothetical protein
MRSDLKSFLINLFFLAKIKNIIKEMLDNIFTFEPQFDKNNGEFPKSADIY